MALNLNLPWPTILRAARPRRQHSPRHNTCSTVLYAGRERIIHPCAIYPWTPLPALALASSPHTRTSRHGAGACGHVHGARRGQGQAAAPGGASKSKARPSAKLRQPQLPQARSQPHTEAAAGGATCCAAGHNSSVQCHATSQRDILGNTAGWRGGGR